MSELDYLKMKLEDKEKAFDKLFKRHMDLLKQKEELEKENEQLKDENASMKGRIINAMVKSNQVECNCSPCVCEDYVNEELKKW